jgi:hypothetical protein
MEPAISLVIPIRTVNRLNARTHWAVRARQTKTERQAVRLGLRQAYERPATPRLVEVILTRMGPSNGLDSDNLAGAMKAVRDGVADWLGVDDRDPRVRWVYEQRRSPTWAVMVSVASEGAA